MPDLARYPGTSTHPQDDTLFAMFAAKSTFRKSMLKTLRSISDSDLQQQSEAVFRSLTQLPVYKSARSVGCYLSMGKGELRTEGIVRDLLARDVKLYTPYLPPTSPSPAPFSAPPASSSSEPALTPTPPPDPMHSPPNDMHMLRLYSLADVATCALDKWGILDPGEKRRHTGEKREDALDISAPDLDIILIPGVAFDVECNRLGRGKAYYDRYLARYTSTRNPPILLALALSPQLLEDDERIPTTHKDFALDGVVTPDRIVWRDGQDKARM